MAKDLTDHQEAFVARYTDPNSPDTFLKPSGAYREAYPAAGVNTVKTNASRLLKSPDVRNRIQEILEEIGFGTTNRLTMTKEIAYAETTRTRTVVLKSGSIVEYEETPDFSQRLRAVEIANKMDGTYAQQQLEKELAVSEHKQLQKELLSGLMKDVSPDKEEK